MSTQAVARVGVDKVSTGLILGGQQSTVYYNGSLVAVVGDAVANHPSSHTGVTLTNGSSTVRIGGRAVVRHGDLASCGHPVTVLEQPGRVRSG
jgi:uncharacterized Zn-binding protein involved in type VI secretion